MEPYRRIVDERSSKQSVAANQSSSLTTGQAFCKPTGRVQRVRQLGAGLVMLTAVCASFHLNSAIAADAAPEASGVVTQAEVKTLRDEIQELKKELKDLKSSTAKATARASKKESTEDDSKSGDRVTRTDLDALRDVVDEEIVRSVGLTGAGINSAPSTAYKVPANGSGNSHFVSISGYGQVGYTAQLTNNKSAAVQSFKLTGAGLTFSGDLRNDPAQDGNLNYALGFAASPSKYVSGISVTSTTSANGTYLNATDVYVNWDIKTAKLEAEPAWTLSLKLGQFLLPYGLENPVGEAARPTIYQAQYISNLGFGRDIGVNAYGGFWNVLDPTTGGVTPYLGYNLGFYNGSGANTLDTNTGKDLLGRLVLTPFPHYFDTFRNLQVGGNFYQGNLNLGNYATAPTHQRYGADISWLRKPFLFTTEWVHSVDGYDGYTGATNNPKVGSPTTAQSSNSYVATLFWTPGTLPDFQPWVRFDSWNPEASKGLTNAQLATANASNTGNQTRNIYSIGFNWFLWQKEPVTRRNYDTEATERVLKLQVDYNYTQQAQWTSGSHNQVDLLVVYSF